MALNHTENLLPRNDEVSGRKKTKGTAVNVIDDKKWTRSDKIAAFALVISVIMAYATFRLFQQSLTQSKAATDSAKAAITADSLSKVYNDSTLKIQRVSLDSQISAKRQSDIAAAIKSRNDSDLFRLQKLSVENNSKDMQERFIRDTTAIGLQIKALRQNQDQFIKQNEPYLQIYIDSLHFIGNRVQIVYTLVNLTPIPVKIIKQVSKVRFSPIEPIINDKDLIISSDINYYVIKESPQNRTITVNDTLSVNERKWIIDASNFTYWKAIFSFQNLISGKIKTYSFYVKLTKLKDKRTYPDFISNDNSIEK